MLSIVTFSLILETTAHAASWAPRSGRRSGACARTKVAWARSVGPFFLLGPSPSLISFSRPLPAIPETDGH